MVEVSGPPAGDDTPLLESRVLQSSFVVMLGLFISIDAVTSLLELAALLVTIPDSGLPPRALATRAVPLLVSAMGVLGLFYVLYLVGSRAIGIAGIGAYTLAGNLVQFTDQAAHVQLRAAANPRHLRFTDQNSTDHLVTG